MEVRERYWEMLVQHRFTSFYLSQYSNNAFRWARRINVFLAIMSSGSIAAWVIWNNIPYVWAVLIAASQVINVINPYLPYSKRYEAITDLLPTLDRLINQVEHSWNRVKQKDCPDDEICDLIFKYNKLYAEIDAKLNKVYVPEKEDYIKIADKKTKHYFDTYFI